MEKIIKYIDNAWANESYLKWTDEEYKYFLKISSFEFSEEYAKYEHLLSKMISKYIYNVFMQDKKLPKKVKLAYSELEKYNNLVELGDQFKNKLKLNYTS